MSMSILCRCVVMYVRTYVVMYVCLYVRTYVCIHLGVYASIVWILSPSLISNQVFKMPSWLIPFLFFLMWFFSLPGSPIVVLTASLARYHSCQSARSPSSRLSIKNFKVIRPLLQLVPHCISRMVSHLCKLYYFSKLKVNKVTDICKELPNTTWVVCMVFNTLKGISAEFQVIHGFSQKIPADLLSYNKIHS